MSANLPFCYRCYTNHRPGPCPDDRHIEETRQLALGYVETEGLYGGMPPHEAVSTSQAAAVSVKPVTGRLRAQVLRTIEQNPDGLTDDDIEVLTGLKHQTASARRRELYLLGKIRSIGERPTRSGRKAKVWIAA